MAQSFSDDFNDGDFTGWGGDSGSFIVTDGELQLNGDCVSGGENYLSVPVATRDSAVWEFYVRCAFDPSTSNYAKVYLQSDNANLLGDVNGYFLQIGGESGSVDAIQLYRQEGTTTSLVLSGAEGAVAIAPTVGVRVIRSDAGEWKLFTDYSGGTDYIFETSAFDTGINGGDYIGVTCTYTSTRCTLFFFDNFYADPLYVDTDAPEISSVSVLSALQLEVTFNEHVALASAETNTNYFVDGGVGNPLNATRDVSDNRKVLLTFPVDFPEGVTLTLSVSGVEDASGNAISLANTTFLYYNVKQYNIIIDEIMADPDPPAGLPNAEYIELYNTTDVDIEITNYYISDAAGASDVFPAFVLAANAYVIISDVANTGLFDAYGDVFYISDFPSLNNDGDHIQLFDAVNTLLHDISYTADWYHDVIKSEGGYALEMIDVNFPCQGENNWNASAAATGGTPGVVNAVTAENPDITAPSVLSAFPPTTDSLIVFFNEALDAESITPGNFFVDNGIGAASSASFDVSNPTVVNIFFTTPFAENILYTVSCSGIKDCSGNEALLNNSAQFGLTTPADSADIVINEILFNPDTDGFDYVELYNRSDKFIDISNIYLAEYDIDDTATITELTVIATAPRLLLPGKYVLITENIDNVAEQYFISTTDNFIHNSGTPNFPDDEGIAAIQLPDGTILDRLHFYSDWHFALLDDENGVSLERLNYDAATQNENNWHSAAEDKHFGTPGYQNSVFGDIAAGENMFSVAYDVFSPDGDGFHDLLIINYNNITSGTTASITIFDAQGRLIKQLANAVTLSSEGFITWDGLNADDAMSRMGIYIAYAEFFDLAGNTQKEKLKFTLVRKQ
jgi:hypothetical protein